QIACSSSRWNARPAAAFAGSMFGNPLTSPGRRITPSPMSTQRYRALDLLAKDRMQDFQELADEAFSDLLRKHGRPTDLKTALRQSVGEMEKRPPAPSLRRRDASRKTHNGG